MKNKILLKQWSAFQLRGKTFAEQPFFNATNLAWWGLSLNLVGIHLTVAECFDQYSVNYFHGLYTLEKVLSWRVLEFGLGSWKVLDFFIRSGLEKSLKFTTLFMPDNFQMLFLYLQVIQCYLVIWQKKEKLYKWLLVLANRVIKGG